MTAFDRTTSPLARSMAYGVFKQRFTEVNLCYWSSIPLVSVLGREANKHQRSALTSNAFGLKGSDVFRYTWTLDQYDEHVKLHANWTPQNAALSLAAALEAFMSRITRVAVLSDPVGVSGWPKLLDGVALLKRGRQSSPETERFTKGDWTSRLSAYEKCFGHAPSTMVAGRRDLDELRKLRNTFAHRLGREGEDGDDPLTLLSQDNMAALSSDRLKKWFKLVSEDVEAHLSADFIGAYELIELYHYWHRDPRRTADRLGVTLKGSDLCDAGFGTLVGARFRPASRVTRTYTADLGRYYRSL